MEVPMDMVEVIAKAMLAELRTQAMDHISYVGVETDINEDVLIDGYVHMPTIAKAALAAMRDMVPVIREDGEVVHEIRGAPGYFWRVMIDGCLTSTSPQAPSSE